MPSPSSTIFGYSHELVIMLLCLWLAFCHLLHFSVNVDSSHVSYYAFVVDGTVKFQETVEFLSAVAVLALAGLILWAKLKDANLDKYKNFIFYIIPTLIILLELTMIGLDLDITAGFWNVKIGGLRLRPFIALSIVHVLISVVFVSALLYTLFMFWRNMGSSQPHDVQA